MRDIISVRDNKGGGGLPLVWCVWGGGNFFEYCGRCMWMWTRDNFFLVHAPPNPWWGSQIQTLGNPWSGPLWALACEDCAVLTLDGLFRGT